MAKKTEQIFTSGKDLLKKTISGNDIKPQETVKQPSQADFAEVCTPDLSTETFQIADKIFKIKISNIRPQKIMAKSLDAITKLLATIDIRAIFDKLKKALNSKDDGYLDMVELVQEIFKQGGLSNIAITIMDLYVGIVFAICNSQDKKITLDWVEENLAGLNQAQEIFFKQMSKDAIGGQVISFLAVATRVLIGTESSSQNT